MSIPVPKYPGRSGVALFMGAYLLMSVGTAAAAIKDSDADGLSDESETATYHTDPNSFDTDGDTIGDGNEVLDGTDPLDPNDSVLTAGDASSDPGIFGEKGKFPWYFGRASGIAAFILLSISACFGLVVSSRTMRSRFAPATSLETHRLLSILSLSLVVLHASSFFFDDFMRITGLEAFIPFLLRRDFASAGGYDLGIAVSLGIIALYGMVILVLTSEFRAKIPAKVWRAIHYISFATYLLFLAHGFTAGTDSGTWWMRAIYITSLMSVLTMVAVRIRYRNAPIRPVSSPTVPPSPVQAPPSVS